MTSPDINWPAFGLAVTAHCRHRAKPPGKLGKQAGVRRDIVVKAMDQKPVSNEAFEKLCATIRFEPAEFYLKPAVKVRPEFIQAPSGPVPRSATLDEIDGDGS